MPKFAILDEIDSGLDIDALKIVSKGVNEMRGGEFGCMIITHYQRLLNYITPDHVHVMMNGKIAAVRTRREIESTGEDLEELFFSITEGCRREQS